MIHVYMAIASAKIKITKISCMVSRSISAKFAPAKISHYTVLNHDHVQVNVTCCVLRGVLSALFPFSM